MKKSKESHAVVQLPEIKQAVNTLEQAYLGSDPISFDKDEAGNHYESTERVRFTAFTDQLKTVILIMRCFVSQENMPSPREIATAESWIEYFNEMYSNSRPANGDRIDPADAFIEVHECLKSAYQELAKSKEAQHVENMRTYLFRKETEKIDARDLEIKEKQCLVEFIDGSPREIVNNFEIKKILLYLYENKITSLECALDGTQLLSIIDNKKRNVLDIGKNVADELDSSWMFEPRRQNSGKAHRAFTRRWIRSERPNKSGKDHRRHLYFLDKKIKILLF